MDEDRTIPDDELIEISGGLEFQIDLIDHGSDPGSEGRGSDGRTDDETRDPEEEPGSRPESFSRSV